MKPDVAVVGAGAFGAWTAWHLHRAGVNVALYDTYGPANSRASSGGESRIIRMGYGAREIYTQWSLRSLAMWRELSESAGHDLFHECGALWIADPDNPFFADSAAVLERCGVPFERLDPKELRRRYPQFHFNDGEWALFEPGAGALMARRCIQTLVARMVAEGVPYERRLVRPEDGVAGSTVFACGPWLPQIFPDVLRRRVVPSRQEVLFFGTPGGEARFGPEGTPCWLDVDSRFYGLPDLEHRGFKLANDRRGVEIDPDTQERSVSAEVVEAGRQYLARRVPSLANAPVLEARVCQYENTYTADYLIDRHPADSNVWLVGGGSGHGFKHGPALGEYLCDLIVNRREPDARFSLDSKVEFEAAEAQSTLYR